MSCDPKLCYRCFRDRPAEPGPCPFCGYDPAAGQKKYPLSLPPGAILAGRYLVGAALGQGGFGITYVARDLAARELVAIKEYLPEGIALRTPGVTQVTALSAHQDETYHYGMTKFLEEAKTLSRFNGHPNIVGVRSYFEENGTAYFAMEYLEGGSLKEYLARQGGRIGWEQAWNLLEPVARALEVVHGAQVVHRDISPDNIYLCRDGRVKLLDFGAARYTLGERSRSMSVILKQGYAPMEQYLRHGKIGPWTDVYALAATFYRAITGSLPPDAPSRMEEDELIPPSALVSVPAAVEDALLKGLAVRAPDRWQSAAEFCRAMNGAAPAPPPEPAPPPPAPEPEPVPPPPAPEPEPAPSPSAPSAPDGQGKKPLAVRLRDRPRRALALKAVAAICALVLVLALTHGAWGEAIASLLPGNSPSVQLDGAFRTGNSSGNLNNGGLLTEEGAAGNVDYTWRYLNQYNGRLYYYDTEDGVVYRQEGEERFFLWNAGGNCHNLIVTSAGVILAQQEEKEKSGYSEFSYPTFFIPWDKDGVSLASEKRIGVARSNGFMFAWEGGFYYCDREDQLRRYDLATEKDTLILQELNSWSGFEMDGFLYYLDAGGGHVIRKLDLRDGAAKEPALVLDPSEDSLFTLWSLNGRGDRIYYLSLPLGTERAVYCYDMRTQEKRLLFWDPTVGGNISWMNVLVNEEGEERLLIYFEDSNEPGYSQDFRGDRIEDGGVGRYLLLDPADGSVARQYLDGESPTDASDGAAFGYLGEILRNGDCEMMVDKAWLTPTLDDYVSGLGKQLLVLRATFTNRSDSARTLYSGNFPIRWLDPPNGGWSEPLVPSGELGVKDQLPAVSVLEPGASATGLLVYEIPMDVLPYFYLASRETFGGQGGSCSIGFKLEAVV